MAENLKVDGLDSIIRKLSKVQPTSLFRSTMTTAGNLFKGWLADYPASTSANSPGQARWYERGYGSRWMKVDGSIGGNPTSETLGKRWATSTSANGMTTTIGNNASYAPYVQGNEQAWYHERNNWRNIKGAVEEMGPKVREFLVAQYRKAING